MMRGPLEDMPLEVLPLIGRVGLETEELGDTEDVCKPRFLDSWKLHERSEFELHSLKDAQGSLGVDKVCARSSHGKLAYSIDDSLCLELVELWCDHLSEMFSSALNLTCRTSSRLPNNNNMASQQDMLSSNNTQKVDER